MNDSRIIPERKGICQPNSAQIPNVIFDHWMKVLTPAEFKVLMCICRKTFGWNKSRDLISIRQIEILTGLARSSVINGLKTLEEHGLVIKHKSKTEWGDDAPNEFEINVYCSTEGDPKEEGGWSSHNTTGSLLTIPQVVFSEDPQKTIYTKDIL